MSRESGPERQWPPAPGDYEVGDPLLPVAICTLGKKISVPSKYAIIGTCKTENIGIERVIVNIVSNPNIRYLILAGPEVPGHRTGSTLRSLYDHGVDPHTRRVLNAPGAIPYVENVPLEAVERFREQIELVDMMNVSDPERIARQAEDLLSRGAEPFPKPPIWVDFGHAKRERRGKQPSGDVWVIPEYGVSIDPATSVIGRGAPSATVPVGKGHVVVEVISEDGGTVLFTREE